MAEQDDKEEAVGTIAMAQGGGGEGPAGGSGVFDLNRLKISQDYVAKGPGRKKTTTIPVRKPNRQEWVRVDPRDSYRITTAVIELKAERNETYIVMPELTPDLPGEFTIRTLVTAVTRQGVLFIWPLKLPGEDGRGDSWNDSALEAAELATRRWVRLSANMHLGAYEIYEAETGLADPEFTDLSFPEILKIAFKDRIVESLEHPVVKHLRGVF